MTPEPDRLPDSMDAGGRLPGRGPGPAVLLPVGEVPDPASCPDGIRRVSRERGAPAPPPDQHPKTSGGRRSGQIR